MITVIDNYDSFTYNLVQYLGDLGVDVRVYRNDKVTVSALLKDKPKAVVISPGPCDPDQAGISLELVKKAGNNLPIFGVCLGYQTIGQAYGGAIIRAPKVMHGKLSTITHSGTGVFRGLPEHFEATRYHSLIVDRKTFPSCLEVTAETRDGIIMGLAHKTNPVHGVLFHPESIASQHGHTVLSNFLDLAGIKHDRPKPAAPTPVFATAV